MIEKKSFFLFKDSLNVLDDLSDKKAGKLFKAIRNYQDSNITPSEFWLKMALKPFVNQFIRDNKQYDAICKKNKNNGSKGGRPKNPVGYLQTQKSQSVNLKPKKADKENDSEKDKDNDIDNVVRKNKIFLPPTSFELYNYFLKKLKVEKKEKNSAEKEKIANKETEKFLNFYKSNGWMVGQNPMAEWEYAAAGWFDKIDQFKKQSRPEQKEKLTGAQAYKKLIENSMTYE